MAHTPGDWKVGSGRGYADINGVQVVCRGYVVAVAVGDVPEVDAKANADFIVRAVNSHDALVDVLTDLRKQAGAFLPLCEPEGSLVAACAKADAALARDGGTK